MQFFCVLIKIRKLKNNFKYLCKANILSSFFFLVAGADLSLKKKIFFRILQCIFVVGVL